MEPLGVEDRAWLGEAGDLLAKTHGNRLGLPGGSARGALDQASDRGKLLLDHGLKPLPFAHACAHELIERSGKACDESMAERRLRFLALLPLNRFHHTPHAEQRVEPRTLEPGHILRPFGHGLGLAERSLVQPDLRLPAFALQPKGDGAIAAGELLLGEAARPDLQPIEARGQTQAQIEVATVDAPRFPMPARVPVHAVGAGKTSHALKGHPVISLGASVHSKPCRL